MENAKRKGRIDYQCGKCGRKFTTMAWPGIPTGMWLLGERAVGNTYYCADCAKALDIDGQYGKTEAGHLFAKWWNKTTEEQCAGCNIKKYHETPWGELVEDDA